MEIIMFDSGFSQPEDKGILLKDVIEGGTVDREKSLCITTRIAGATEKRYLEKSLHQMVIDDKTIMTDTFAERQKGRNCLVDEPKDKAASLCAMEYLKNGRQGDYIQCDSEGNQTVFRPCELRDTPPAESALCHHVATATDIKANEANKCVYADTGKSPTVTTMGGGHREPKVLVVDKKYRKLTPRECMRLQGFTEEVIEKLLSAGISNSQLYKMTGNSFTMPVIKHNLQCLINTGWMK